MSSTEINLDTHNSISLTDTTVAKSGLQASLQSSAQPDMRQNTLPNLNNMHNASDLNSDNVSLLSTNNITKKYVLNMIYLLSHIAFASILVICLKNTNTPLLAVLLSLTLGYISYDEQHNMPIYTLFLVGSLLYFFDLFIIGKQSKDFEKTSILNTLKRTIWKLPYYGILSYYVILYVTYSFKDSK